MDLHIQEISVPMKIACTPWMWLQAGGQSSIVETI